VRPLVPEAGMFMLLDVSATGLTGTQFVREFYASQRVSVMDGAAFGAATAACVRVCFATDEATLDSACRRLQLFCAQDVPRLTGRGP
jgi:arginine:pyruvate transaminase